MIDWDDAYDNVGHIPGAASYPERWSQQASDYRSAADFAELDIAYGSHPRERYDLFHPRGQARGVVVVVHGGYWMRLDKSYWSDLAEGARVNGWKVAIPSYPLTPEARISEITSRIGAAIQQIGSNNKGPLRLAGHSAGGHLVTRMVCDDTPLPASIASRIEHILSISGLHDLRPLLRTRMNQTLGLTADEAEGESACLHQPLERLSLTAWVGSDERPEYLRQMRCLCDHWKTDGARIEGIVDPGHHHFSIIEALGEPDSKIVGSLLS